MLVLPRVVLPAKFNHEAISAADQVEYCVHPDVYAKLKVRECTLQISVNGHLLPGFCGIAWIAEHLVWQLYVHLTAQCVSWCLLYQVCGLCAVDERAMCCHTLNYYWHCRIASVVLCCTTITCVWCVCCKGPLWTVDGSCQYQYRCTLTLSWKLSNSDLHGRLLMCLVLYCIQTWVNYNYKQIL